LVIAVERPRLTLEAGRIACAIIAERIIVPARPRRVNVLDFGERGWLAIDPKYFYGERTFDYANIFCNPDGETITTPGRMARQVSLISEEANIDKARLLRWILAWAGLSSAWHLSYGGTAKGTLTVAEIAAAELDHLPDH
jgi:streptomycin 6-kinase